ncbi:ribonuclease HI [Cellulophaga sp. E16_2]|uniref:ribonuclease H n=1 Tax=Cellulophaga algicola (strain DSM 14237 / IC166 / ACAM 630) TaxID=688270 RepID=E6X7Z9_CELAD|nr:MULTISPECIES: ribonuclease HI [Cellulophaga]ADV48597.1 Ribonuclease H [Cellulophaga algicola DSM 14237]MBO0591015.1 ribonuclease HI [Cellulophaga sp. E16_2]
MDNIQVHIYTDGAARGNPGPGGYGIVMEWVGKPYKKEFSEGFKHTTNNRMELLAVIEALKKLKNEGTAVKVFTDSKYVVDTVEKKWYVKWEKTNFKDKKNPDLWKLFLIEYRKQKVSFQWIKGHNNHRQNERCDTLAVAASKERNLKEDTGFITN